MNWYDNVFITRSLSAVVCVRVRVSVNVGRRRTSASVSECEYNHQASKRIYLMNTRHHVRLRNVRVPIVRKVKTESKSRADKGKYLLLARTRTRITRKTVEESRKPSNCSSVALNDFLSRLASHRGYATAKKPTPGPGQGRIRAQYIMSFIIFVCSSFIYIFTLDHECFIAIYH